MAAPITSRSSRTELTAGPIAATTSPAASCPTACQSCDLSAKYRYSTGLLTPAWAAIASIPTSGP